MSNLVDYSAFAPKQIPSEKQGLFLKNTLTGKYARWEEALLKRPYDVTTTIFPWVEVPAEEFYNYLREPLPERYKDIPAARIRKAETAPTPAPLTEDTAQFPNANAALMEGVSDGSENDR